MVENEKSKALMLWFDVGIERDTTQSKVMDEWVS